MLFVDHLPIKMKNGTILLYVRAMPNASSTKIGGIFNGMLKIYITALPQAGQANKSIIELLADKLEIPKKDIILVNGASDRNKVFQLNGDANKIIKLLQIIIQE